VNVVGSFALGVVAFSGLDGDLMLFVGVGACGSFTTYSSFSVETVQLWTDGDRFRATLYALGSLGLCLAAVAIAAGLVSLAGG
jgi:CrcB protein